MEQPKIDVSLDEVQMWLGEQVLMNKLAQRTISKLSEENQRLKEELTKRNSK